MSDILIQSLCVEVQSMREVAKIHHTTSPPARWGVNRETRSAWDAFGIEGLLRHGLHLTHSRSILQFQAGALL
jgi:hypothetical protein